MRTHFDAVIIGGGPGGATVANLLERDGLHVSVFDSVIDVIRDKERLIGVMVKNASGEVLPTYFDMLFDCSGSRTVLPNLLKLRRETRRVYGQRGYSTTRTFGEGWVLVGDTAFYMDPDFSFGLPLTTSSAKEAATLYIKLRHSLKSQAEVFRTYEKTMRREERNALRFVDSFYMASRNRVLRWLTPRSLEIRREDFPKDTFLINLLFVWSKLISFLFPFNIPEITQPIVTGDRILMEREFFIGRSRVQAGTSKPGTPSLLRLIQLFALEHLSRDTLKRQPEPSLVMDTAQNVVAFDLQGQEEGPLIPLYHFNALGISRLLPKGGRLLDLGSGSGRLLAYLAQGRPDVEIIGLELSQPMVEAGNRLFKQLGLFPRVRLEKGDMTRLTDRKLDSVDVISMNLALEHLPDFDAVQSLITQIKQCVDELGCGFWLFNHSRPKTQAAAELFPEVFTPNAPQSFREDSRNSLIASWTYSELMPLFRFTLGDDIQGQLSHLLPYYLTFWLDPSRRPTETGLWQGRARPTGTAGQQFSLFRALYFPEVPLDQPRQTPLPTPLPLESRTAE